MCVFSVKLKVRRKNDKSENGSTRGSKNLTRVGSGRVGSGRVDPYHPYLQEALMLCVSTDYTLDLQRSSYMRITCIQTVSNTPRRHPVREVIVRNIQASERTQFLCVCVCVCVCVLCVCVLLCVCVCVCIRRGKLSNQFVPRNKNMFSTWSTSRCTVFRIVEETVRDAAFSSTAPFVPGYDIQSKVVKS